MFRDIVNKMIKGKRIMEVRNMMKSRGVPDNVVVVIDAGHGGRDTGAVFEDVVEKDIALKTALWLGDTLKSVYGWKVHFTRTDDKTVNLWYRNKMACNVGADLYVSVHYNAGGNAMTMGGEVWANIPAMEREYDFNFLKEGYTQVHSRWRGVKDANHWYGRVLYIANPSYRCLSSIPSVLWEVEFVQAVKKFGWWDGKKKDWTHKGYSDVGFLIGKMAVDLAELMGR